MNFWSRRGGETRGAQGGAGRPLMRRQFPRAWGAFSAGCVRQVFAAPGMGGLGLPLRGGARASRRRCCLGPNEGAGGGEERKGSPGGSPPHPRAAGIDPLCVWSRAELPAVPRARSRGAGGTVAGNSACLAPTPLSPSLVQNFFLGFQPGGGDWGKFFWPWSEAAGEALRRDGVGRLRLGHKVGKSNQDSCWKAGLRFSAFAPFQKV